VFLSYTGEPLHKITHSRPHTGRQTSESTSYNNGKGNGMKWHNKCPNAMTAHDKLWHHTKESPLLLQKTWFKFVTITTHNNINMARFKEWTLYFGPVDFFYITSHCQFSHPSSTQSSHHQPSHNIINSVTTVRNSNLHNQYKINFAPQNMLKQPKHNDIPGQPLPMI